jgi:hypothetical protein
MEWQNELTGTGNASLVVNPMIRLSRAEDLRIARVLKRMMDRMALLRLRLTEALGQEASITLVIHLDPLKYRITSPSVPASPPTTETPRPDGPLSTSSSLAPTPATKRESPS